MDSIKNFPNAKCHIDPVLLHDSAWWSNFSVKPTHIEIPETYDSVMFIPGTIDKNEINVLRSENDVPIINLLDSELSP